MPLKWRRSPIGSAASTAGSTSSSTTSGAPRCSRAAPPEWNTPIWEHDLDKGLRILRLAVDTHLITAHHLLPLVIARPGGLVVEVTDGTLEYNADALSHLGLLRPRQGRRSNRLAYSQGHELAPHGATAVVDHAGLAAVRDDARGVRRRRSRAGVTRWRPRRRRRRRPASRPPSRHATSGARSRRSPPIPIGGGWNQQSRDRRATGARVRVHRRRRIAARRVALHGRRRSGPRRRSRAVPLSPSPQREAKRPKRSSGPRRRSRSIP